MQYITKPSVIQQIGVLYPSFRKNEKRVERQRLEHLRESETRRPGEICDGLLGRCAPGGWSCVTNGVTMFSLLVEPAPSHRRK